MVLSNVTMSCAAAMTINAKAGWTLVAFARTRPGAILVSTVPTFEKLPDSSGSDETGMPSDVASYLILSKCGTRPWLCATSPAMRLRAGHRTSRDRALTSTGTTGGTDAIERLRAGVGPTR
ncbi:long-chain-fatty-acid--CoA ligase [Mycolicibacterium novocastrense]|uniref:Long-chain-fatty-acid--CoA ligase n=1 Tax=Mycolicibacterium novocastrense TaxID=59813 RepID=A0ABQ0KUE4_MYCNV|nr:long-chain-fatty-acid--CoA ligase [Mycolicibacterium novocastrense]